MEQKNQTKPTPVKLNRRQYREHTFCMLFLQGFHPSEEIPAQLSLYLDTWQNISEQDRTSLIERVQNVIPKLTEIDEKISNVSDGWSVGRMSKVDLSILRLAVYEMEYVEDVPVSVAINEAVELAKMYGGENSPGFINGILAKLVPNEE